MNMIWILLLLVWYLGNTYKDYSINRKEGEIAWIISKKKFQKMWMK